MSRMRDVDVAIVGAGMAGGALALALAGQGLRLALVESRPLTPPPLPAERDVTSFDTRVSALNPESVALLERLGAWPDIAAYRHCPYHHMTVWDAEGTGHIEFDAADVDSAVLGHIVENRAVVSALLSRLQAAADLQVLAPARLAALSQDEDMITLDLEGGDSLRAGLLVAADGALSSVRSLLDFRTREWDYGHRALVTTVVTEHPHQNTARQRFLPSGPLAFLPLPGGEGRHVCSIVWSLREELADEVLALDDAAFCQRLGEAFEHHLGRVLAASPRTAFPLRQRHAVDYVQSRVALVGDAAHTIHPLAGQGINLGFKDVAVLAEEVVSAHRRGRDIGRLEVLRRYQRRRKGENLLMMGAMDVFKTLFEQEALPLRWLRSAGMGAVHRAGPLKQEIMRRAMGLGS
ncbi:UbiH/UbiF/VisC/COQ6 family ubiquinone biosynthesis hydroxylase [Parahaliea aestuarii]|uniref:UbiH/UbiF/VisC/COQ6 family ubiquinone biosynthesis hydroxylase n=1 Tax=Parahaliea aestuarii TaxID=1852021 RepID=A0A5C8ZZE3_9GAMM|nr:UbiH/UbiF/VisC/COQ6 family ubiquinone biosynthesis hydroxylase [Parahaliea aestuarii]TXS92591.1 UbiH/UbiF/VisC/COQ6 family ubiquinone biosynthesis hydroxylase [Parahaliea aestuarii]